MQPDLSWTEPPASFDRRLGILVVAILVASALAVVGLVWYPSTLQPAVALTGAKFVQTASCVFSDGWYSNRYAWSFTLINAGNADGYASAEFFINGAPNGYLPFLVGQHSQVTETGVTGGYNYPTLAACGAPETLTVSLASVTRSPVIDERGYIQATVGPLSTLGFVGAMLGILNSLAHRRGFSIFVDAGKAGWVSALLMIFAATLFSGVVTLILVTPYNYPPDWTPAIGYGAVAGTMGVAAFLTACRVILRGRPYRRGVGSR